MQQYINNTIACWHALYGFINQFNVRRVELARNIVVDSATGMRSVIFSAHLGQNIRIICRIVENDRPRVEVEVNEDRRGSGCSGRIAYMFDQVTVGGWTRSRLIRAKHSPAFRRLLVQLGYGLPISEVDQPINVGQMVEAASKIALWLSSETCKQNKKRRGNGKS
jgi:hypothetical protein